MGKDDLVAELLKLGIDDREYIRDVLNTSLESDVPCELTPDEQAVLLGRLEDFRKNPESFLTWEQVKVKVAEQRSRKHA